MKRRLPTVNQGEVVLAAISLPPVTDEANRHAPSRRHPGRQAAAANATPIAVSANRPAPAGRVTASSPSSTASAANATPSSAARARNRRTQPRAVVYGTPARSAAGRTPHPPPGNRPRRSDSQAVNNTALPATQALLLPLYFISGVLVTVTILPHWLADAGTIFPVRHLANALLITYNPHTTGLGSAGVDLLIVAAWGAAGLLIALRTFSWQPLGR